MNRLARTTLALLAAALMSAGAHAQPAAADDSLYQAFGGQPGLVRLMDDFMARLLADARMRRFFQDADAAALKKQLVLQFCEVSGGPCRRDGPTMKEAHDGMDITRGDFNALVEVLQDAMDAQGVPFRAQNRLLARLAPMHRDIVNTP
ncbi:MAG: group 1 truncated hemoglobin [Immundisolibacter sp.]|uniref:group I truncated hemoglobin n=1 Tax=Immundisolibacter sp. TaxID=1934948 RepID=UPI003D1031A8